MRMKFIERPSFPYNVFPLTSSLYQKWLIDKRRDRNEACDNRNEGAKTSKDFFARRKRGENFGERKGRKSVDGM